MKRVCIIGSGPGAFFTAGHLLKQSKNVLIDIMDKLPTGHGLIRYGVAPDHQYVKIVEKKFASLIKSDSRLQFFGGVEVGHVVSVSKLRKLYNAVVVASGCSRPRSLNIPGEFGSNIVSSHDFVSWYNGHPHFAHLPPNLNMTHSDTAIVLGQGNVALDVARILLTPAHILHKNSDMSKECIDVLQQSTVSKVYCIGRRHLTDVSFTIKEFRDITKIPNVDVDVAVESSESPAVDTSNLSRPKKRLMELCLKHHKGQSHKIDDDAVKNFVLLFNRTPTNFLIDDSSLAVKGVRFKQTQTSSGNREKEDKTIEISAGLVVKSIGYEGLPIDIDVPFDHNRSVILHQRGKVDSGLYCSGWAKTGPVGVVASTLQDAQETAESLLKDLTSLPDIVQPGGIEGYLNRNCMTFVDTCQWVKLFEEELKLASEGEKKRDLNIDISATTATTPSSPPPNTRVKFSNYLSILDFMSDNI